MADSSTNYGLDIAGVFGFDLNLSVINTRMIVIQAVMRRLITPRGSLFYDRNYGFDIRGLLMAAMTELEMSAIAEAIEGECEKDARVMTARVTVRRNTDTALVTIRLATSTGPFSMVLSVSELTVELLKVEES